VTYFVVLDAAHKAMPLSRGELEYSAGPIPRVPGQHVRIGQGYLNALAGPDARATLTPDQCVVLVGLRHHNPPSTYVRGSQLRAAGEIVMLKRDQRTEVS